MMDFLFRFFFGLGFVVMGFFYLRNWRRVRGDEFVGYLGGYYLAYAALMFILGMVFLAWSVVTMVQHWG